jgi:hypothetical protein
MKKIILAILLTAVLLTACGKSGMDSSKEAMDGMDHGQHNEHLGGSKADEAIHATFKLNTDKPQAKQDTAISIQITDDKNKSIDKFDLNHEKMLHLIVVSKDLSFFHHIHPAYKGKGVFDITTQLPAGGDYKLIADFKPTGQEAMNKSKWITVQGDASKPAAIEPDKELIKVVDGKEVTLTFDHLMAGMELNMNFSIKDAQTKQPITNLQQYLGAVGHVVIVSADAEQYIHVHPIEEKATGPDAKFMTSFPKSGIYKIWGQFQHEGKVFTVPFTVNVP